MEIYFKARKGRFSEPALPKYPYLILQRDGWNDYSYRTLYVASLQISKGSDQRINLGPVKVMRLGQSKGESTFPESIEGPIESSQLAGTHCSLSSDGNYYDALQSLEDQGLAIQVLEALQDASFLPTVRKIFQDDDCFKISLLRESDARRLLDEAGERFGVRTDAVVKFEARITLDGASAPHAFYFDFGGDYEILPIRIHAIVGLNGVGKTQVLARLAVLLSRFSREAIKDNRSTLESGDVIQPIPSIYSVVAISFSAFDEFERPTELQGERFSYSYCGLRTRAGKLRSEEELLSDIKQLIAERMDGEKRELLVKVLERLVKVDDLRDFIFDVQGNEQLYGRLSAGQRIVLNSLCHLLSKISSRTLVLFDEPELHLHPQLLSGMMAALNEILIAYKSYAIVATHSPIVIQEIPRNCIHVIRRERMRPYVYNPTFETFGENLSEIARGIFVATDSDRDYRNVLQGMWADSNGNVERVSEIFGGRLSLNARIFLESLSKDDFPNT